MLSLDRLNDERLSVSIVDLAFILVKDPVGFILQVRFVVTSLR